MIDIISPKSKLGKSSTEIIATFLDVVKSYDIDNIAFALSEETVCMGKSNYYFLSVLRDVFTKFKELGDDKLIFSEGICNEICYKNCSNPYRFRGNKSGKSFIFVTSETEDGIKEINFCYNYIDENGIKDDKYHLFLWEGVKKMVKLEKE